MTVDLEQEKQPMFSCMDNTKTKVFLVVFFTEL